MRNDLPNASTFFDVAEKRHIKSISLRVGYFAVSHTKTMLPPEAIGLVIEHCIVVGVVLHFTAVTSWAAQSVVERPVSAAYSTQCIIA